MATVGEASEQKCLVIAHFNDLHGHVERAPQMATIIKRVAQDSYNKGCETLVLFGGDLISGTFISNRYKGRAEFDFLKALKVNATVLGNHDFDFGDKALRFNMESVAPELPYVGANIFYCKDGPCTNFVLPYTTIQLGSLKIAIFGLAHPDTEGMSLPENIPDLKFEDTEAFAVAMMQGLSRDSNVQIALTHEGVTADQKIAREVPGIDVIVGGHDHVKPQAYCDKDLPTPVCQTPPYGTFVGRIQLNVEGNKVTRVREDLIQIDESIPPDPEVARIMKPYFDEAAPEMNRVVGNRPAPTTKDQLLKEMVNAMRESTGASFSFTNSSGVRGTLPAGNITIDNIFQACPFNNTVVVGKIRGVDVRTLVKKSVERGYRGLVFSGLTYSTRGTQPINIMIGGKPLNDRAVYMGATIDFLAAGSSNYEHLKTKFVVEKKLGLVRDLIAMVVGKK